MDTIYRGGLDTRAGRRLAWVDSLLVDHAVLRLAWTNAGAVAPGRLYRCNHPTPGRLTALVGRWGIRTVINLRGATGNGSDALSRERAHQLGLFFVDMPMSSGRAPSRDAVLALAAALETMEEPGLVHCKSGADRAGFAGVLFLLLNGVAVADAVGAQLSLRWGHIARSRAGVLDAFFHAYARAEAGKAFLDWVREDYDPAAIAAEFASGRLGRFVQDRVLRRE